jgi:hypothetical protein
MAGSPQFGQAIGLTGRNASWARRILRLDREVRRLGACMAVNFQRLKCLVYLAKSLQMAKWLQMVANVQNGHAAVNSAGAP